MSKNIVLMFDGTKNNKDDPRQYPTNVGKLSRALECDSDHQRSYYICGVGTTGEFIEKRVGRAGGYGLSANIIEGYRYLCKNFLKCEGDRIYLFGFSRGAFTARSLAGFADSVGILLANSVDDKIEQAFALYQLGIAGDKSELRQFLQEEVRQESPEGDNELPIYFIGLWDTVKALGLPGVLGDYTAPYTEFHQPELTKNVTNAYHALALHELRAIFDPVLWTRKTRNGQVVEQVWFAGDHADVGGGYPISTLSDIALRWMTCKAMRLGLYVDEDKLPIPKKPSARALIPNHEIRGLFLLGKPTVRPMLPHQFEPAIRVSAAWRTINVHESVVARTLSSDAQRYRYWRPYVNKRLKEADDQAKRLIKFCKEMGKVPAIDECIERGPVPNLARYERNASLKVQEELVADLKALVTSRDVAVLENITERHIMEVWNNIATTNVATRKGILQAFADTRNTVWYEMQRSDMNSIDLALKWHNLTDIIIEAILKAQSDPQTDIKDTIVNERTERRLQKLKLISYKSPRPPLKKRKPS